MPLMESIIDFVRRYKFLVALLVLGPPLIYLAVYFFAPFLITILYSFGFIGRCGVVTWKLTIKYYQQALKLVYLKVFYNSVVLAGITTIGSLLMAYPVAYFIAVKAPKKWKNALVVSMMIPYWVDFLLRTYALMNIFTMIGIMFTYEAVVLGMIYDYLPFMVLPLYANLEKLDKSLLEASYTLGATPMKTFLKVTLPLSMPGIASGTILVFVPAIGEFIVPSMLGGVSVSTIGILTWDLFLKFHNWWRGAALSILYIAVVLVTLIIYMKKVGELEI
ncbi:MAG TPA: ABC transporter permease [Candidatus Korarchaeota archaeon]|nr:ABC transporter permease [Candidatus Korarchaeota archaeon]